MSDPELCKECGLTAVREFVPCRLYFNGTKVEHAEYNPGLGMIVRNKEHRKEICKSKGLEELGNEKVENLHRHFEKTREEKWEKGWEKITAGWVGDGSS